MIDIYPPPPLHLIKLGPLNKVYGESRNRVDLTEFEKKINVKREEYHSGEFEGNECTRIMKNLDMLEELVAEEDCELLPFIENLRDLKSLDEVVNSEILPENFNEVIHAFEDSYRELNEKFQVSITNKVHIIFSHLEIYLENTGETLLKKIRSNC